MPNCTLDAASCGILRGLVVNILNPILLLLTGIAGVVFIFGVLEFLWSLSKGQNPETGKLHMIWGVVGLFVMVGALGILNVIESIVQGLFR